MFSHKETLIQNIAFMGIMAAINVVLSVLSALFPIAGIFIIILLPFISSLVAFYCKWRYYPIYAVATFGVALGVTFFNTEFTVFYLVPSLITGFMFGLCFYKKLNGTYTLLFTSIIQSLLTFALIPLINLIYGVDLVGVFLKLFGLSGNQNAITMVPSFIYFISLAQMVLSYIILHNEISKFTPIDNDDFGIVLKIIGISAAIIVIPFLFINISVAYLFMFVGIFLSISFIVHSFFFPKKIIFIVSLITIGLSAILPLIFYQLVKMPYTLLLLNSGNILIFFVALLYNQNRYKEV